MFDIHTHILPFVDDGSASLESSLDLLYECKNLGIDKVVLTPHNKGKIYCKSKKTVIDKFNKFKDVVKEKKIEIDVYLGQEVYVDGDIYAKLKNDELLTINGTKYLLIEFNYFTETDIIDYVYNLNSLGVKPIIAHVERYTYLDFGLLPSLKSAGALLQVNASCIMGDLGKKKQKQILSAIKVGLIDFVASDVHHNRTNYMQQAYQKVLKVVGKDLADKLFELNAKNLFIV